MLVMIPIIAKYIKAYKANELFDDARSKRILIAVIIGIIMFSPIIFPLFVGAAISQGVE